LFGWFFAVLGLEHSLTLSQALSHLSHSTSPVPFFFFFSKLYFKKREKKKKRKHHKRSSGLLPGGIEACVEYF
jgi:hypothetical protein